LIFVKKKKSNLIQENKVKKNKKGPAKAIIPATLAGGNGSFIALVKAGINTFLLVFYLI